MINPTALFPTFLAAADQAGELTSRVYDLPKEPWQMVSCTSSASSLSTVFVIALYLRDTSDYSPFWKVWLTTLRLSVLVILAVIIFNPQERTQTVAFRPSRVAVLVDTSLSMGDPAASPSTDEAVHT